MDLEMARTHRSSPIIVIWLTLLVPLTIWDSAYIFLRPHSLPGGKWHEPYFHLHKDYAGIDLMYSRQGWESGDGFVAAHCVLHLTECALGACYLCLLFKRGQSLGWFGLHRALNGDAAGLSVVIGIVEAAMTLEMTVLCCTSP